MRTLGLVLLLWSSLEADTTPGDTIDQALVYIEAGRPDVADELFAKLLTQNLTPDEKATVLFDMATIRALGGRTAEAIKLYDQVNTSDQNLESAANYNRALCLLEVAKEKEDSQAIEMATEAIKAVKPSLLISKTMLAEAYGALASIALKLKTQNFEAKLHSMSKQELLNSFLAYQRKEFLTLAQAFGEEGVSLYIDNYKDANQYKMQLYIDRIIQFLEAPAIAEVVQLRDFFIEKLLSLEASSERAESLDSLLSGLYAMMQTSYLIQKTAQGDIALPLLEERVQVAAEKRFSSKASQRFWDAEVKNTEDFAREYLHHVQKALSDPFEAALVQRLSTHIEKSQDPDADLLYWQRLSSHMNTLYAQLIENKDPHLLKAGVDRLSAYQEVHKNVERALDLLSRADRASNYRQALIESWFLLYPRSAMSYYADWLQKQIEQGHVVPEDMREFTGLLARLPPKTLPISTVQELLRTHLTATLFWLKWYLSSEDATVQNIVLRLDAALYYQYLIPERTFEELGLQKLSVKKIDELVSKSTIAKALKNELHSIFTQCVRVLGQGGDISSLLIKAKMLLQKEEAAPVTAPNMARQTTQEKSNLAMQMQKKTLHLSGETSIRLLQEMEREDASLFEKKSLQPEGARPW